jgi:hypothetical protein
MADDVQEDIVTRLSALTPGTVLSDKLRGQLRTSLLELWDTGTREHPRMITVTPREYQKLSNFTFTRRRRLIGEKGRIRLVETEPRGLQIMRLLVDILMVLIKEAARAPAPRIYGPLQLELRLEEEYAEAELVFAYYEIVLPG